MLTFMNNWMDGWVNNEMSKWVWLILCKHIMCFHDNIWPERSKWIGRFFSLLHLFFLIFQGQLLISWWAEMCSGFSGYVFILCEITDYGVALTHSDILTFSTYCNYINKQLHTCMHKHTKNRKTGIVWFQATIKGALCKFVGKTGITITFKTLWSVVSPPPPG